MKVILVYPGFVKIGFNSLGTGGLDTCWLNLGLAYIASSLKKHGHEVSLIDLRDLAGWDEFDRRIVSDKGAVFGIHVNTPNFNLALECARRIKSVGGVTVCGGPHVTIDSEAMSALPYVDYLIKGEGELAFPGLLKSIQCGEAVPKIIQGQRVESLDDLPFPDRDIYNIPKVLHLRNAAPFMDTGMILMAGRGCPFNCGFCQPLVKRVFGEKIRMRSVPSVMEEIKQLIAKYRCRYISFQDDTFTINKKWVLEFCNAIKSTGLEIQWSAQSRVNTLDEEMAVAMKEAGCDCLFFGFESGSQKILDFLNKGITVDQSLRAGELCHKHGLLIFADYMLGIPGETEDDLRATYELMKRIRPQICAGTFFTPVPGSSLYEYCLERDLSLIKNYEDTVRNPLGEKVRGVDYALAHKYNDKIVKECQAVWFEDRHYAKIMLKRWGNMVGNGLVGETLREIRRTSSFKHYFLTHMGFRRA